MAYGDWYIIDEDKDNIVGVYTGTEDEAVEWFKACKEERDPGASSYWDTWSLFKRVEV